MFGKMGERGLRQDVFMQVELQSYSCAGLFISGGDNVTYIPRHR